MSIKRCNIDELIDLSELTWEQREQVLRELFARMNGNKAAKKSKEQQQPLAIESNKDGNNEDEDEDEDTVVRFMDMADLKRPDLPSKYFLFYIYVLQLKRLNDCYF